MTDAHLPQLGKRVTGAALSLLPWARQQLQRYVLSESPSGDVEALSHCVNLVEAGHGAAGGCSERVSSERGDHLITQWGPEKQSDYLLVLGHYDTVWPVEQLRRMPYRDEDDVIAGPGGVRHERGWSCSRWRC